MLAGNEFAVFFNSTRFVASTDLLRARRRSSTSALASSGGAASAAASVTGGAALAPLAVDGGGSFTICQAEMFNVHLVDGSARYPIHSFHFNFHQAPLRLRATGFVIFSEQLLWTW